ncbi:hypothetical protein HK098_005451 [Nowakowskiella sp. JEL0407]|nr:hypothetical protein HK098_005451 [Nowakowskiella sp. JEL0407]
MSPVSYSDAWNCIDFKTKPPGALGDLEFWATKLIFLQQTYAPKIESGRILLFAADHGIADEDVSQYPKVVTREMLRNLSSGGAAINAYCNAGSLSLEVMDVGVDTTETFANIIHSKASPTGTKSSLSNSAMTLSEYESALTTGRDAVNRYIAFQNESLSSYLVAIGIGELGIGNTATGSILLLAHIQQSDPEYSAELITGRGTGISDERLVHKADVISRVTAFHKDAVSSSKPGAEKYKEIMVRMGGLEVVAMMGAIHECALKKIPVLVDGFISQVACLYALLVFDDDRELLRNSIFVSHKSAEKAGTVVLQEIEKEMKKVESLVQSNVDGREIWKVKPVLDLGMRLGEGTGAALAFSLLKAAAHMASDMATFASAGVSGSK